MAFRMRIARAKMRTLAAKPSKSGAGAAVAFAAAGGAVGGQGGHGAGSFRVRRRPKPVGGGDEKVGRALPFVGHPARAVFRVEELAGGAFQRRGHDQERGLHAQEGAAIALHVHHRGPGGGIVGGVERLLRPPGELPEAEARVDPRPDAVEVFVIQEDMRVRFLRQGLEGIGLAFLPDDRPHRLGGVEKEPRGS